MLLWVCVLPVSVRPAPGRLGLAPARVLLLLLHVGRRVGVVLALWGSTSASARDVPEELLQ